MRQHHGIPVRTRNDRRTSGAADWIAALWLVACLAFAVAGTTVGILQKDVALLAPSSTAGVGLTVVLGMPVASWLSRRLADRRDPGRERPRGRSH